MSTTRRPGRLLALLVCVGALLVACDPTGADPAPSEPIAAPTIEDTPGTTRARGGTLRYAVSDLVTVPFDATDGDGLVVVDALFDGLTSWATNLSLAPSAAESWRTPDEGRTWEFVLREDATFHDGTPVQAQDFVFTWNLAAAEGAAGFHLRLVDGYPEVRAGEARELDGLDAVDDRTLRVRLREPYGAFPSVVAHPALAPVPRSHWNADPTGFRRQPVGNGAFMAAETAVPGQFLRVQRFDDWRNGPEPAELDEVLFQISDRDTAYVAFQQGRLQVSPLPEEAVDEARQRYGEGGPYAGPGVVDGPTTSVYFLAFDVTEPPFDVPEVRRAVSLAIDREAIAAAVLGGNTVPARELVAPAVSRTQSSCAACVHDPATAERILDEYEIDTLTLWFNREGGHRVVAERIRADLMAVGVRRVVFRAPDFAGLVGSLERGEAGFFRFGWQLEYPLADDILFPLFHSSGIPQDVSEPEDDEPPTDADGSAGESDAGAAGEPSPDATSSTGQGEAADPGQDTEDNRVGEPSPEPAEDPAATPGGEASAAPAEDPAAPTGEASAAPAEDPSPEPAEDPAGADARQRPGAGRNYMRYADAEVDALLDEARATTSSARRRYLSRLVEEIVLDRDQVVVPILFYRHQLVVDPSVADFRINPLGIVDLHRVRLDRGPAAQAAGG